MPRTGSFASRWFTIGLVAAGVAAACGDKSDDDLFYCDRGSEGCPCASKDLCLPGLVCDRAADVCVEAVGSGGTSGSATGGAIRARAAAVLSLAVAVHRRAPAGPSHRGAEKRRVETRAPVEPASRARQSPEAPASLARTAASRAAARPSPVPIRAGLCRPKAALRTAQAARETPRPPPEPPMSAHGRSRSAVSSTPGSTAARPRVTTARRRRSPSTPTRASSRSTFSQRRSPTFPREQRSNPLCSSSSASTRVTPSRC